MITTPEIICDLFSFLGKDQIERIQLVNQFWNNVIIRHKNILLLRQFSLLKFGRNQILLYVIYSYRESYKIEFNGTNLSKIEMPSRLSQLTDDELFKSLTDVVFDEIEIKYYEKDHPNNLLNMIKLVTAKTEGRFRGIYGKWNRGYRGGYEYCDVGRFGSKLNEIFGRGFLNAVVYKIHLN